MKGQAKSPSPERLLTLSEVAAILGTSERFSRRLIAALPNRIRQGRPSRPHSRIGAG